jgi:16S rRNA (uracil1498-N3)-methyltransferase
MRPPAPNTTSFEKVKKMPRRFFVEPEKLQYPYSTLTGQDLAHARNVLRLKPGDEVALFDGSGVEHIGRIASVSAKEAVVEMIGKKDPEPEPSVAIDIAQAFLKEKKMDLCIRALTELGTARWRPFFSERSVPVPDAKRLVSRVLRWEKIMKEAAKQCRRNRLVEIAAPVSFDDALQAAETSDIKIMFWENATRPLDPKIFPDGKNEIRTVFALVGPEGGFSGKEARKALDAGFATVGMGPRILRAETAVLACAALLQYCFGDMGKKIP